MSNRFFRVATVLLVVACMSFLSSRVWAVFHALGPSQDDWKLKYDVDVTAAEGDKLNVSFTVADEGRLKPFYSTTLIAFSKQTDSQGGRSYDVKAPIALKPTADGKLTGQAQMPKQFADRAIIRILTLTVDGKRQTAGAAYYDIPLQKFVNQ